MALPRPRGAAGTGTTRPAGSGSGKRAVLTALVVLLSVSHMVMIPLAFHLAPSSSSSLDAAGGTIPSKASFAARRVADKARRPPPPADGTLNGHPMYYRANKTLHSSVSCVGENYRPNAWIHRSCAFRHLCFDLAEKEFVVYQSPEERAMEDALRVVDDFAFASSRMTNTSVAIGGINQKRDVKANRDAMRWFPRVVRGALDAPYYELAPDVVWVPFHSFFAGNPGHLIWDDFLPVYTLMRMFGWDRRRPLLTRYIVGHKGEEARGLWATCEWTKDRLEECTHMLDKFLPLMGLRGDHFTTTRDVRVALADGGPRKSDLVCATRGAAGIGMLTDHGEKLHGWSRKDYDSMHNHGRSSLLYEFRNFMVDNILRDAGAGVADHDWDGMGRRKRPKGPPYIVTVSVGSSTSRALQNQGHINELKQAFGDRIRTQIVTNKELSTFEQVRVAMNSAIYITMCGGGAVTAMFLPEGSSAILYYKEDGGIEKGRKTQAPALLDWDVWNNMAWIRTHWMPTARMRLPSEVEALIKLVGHELDIMADEDAL